MPSLADEPHPATAPKSVDEWVLALAAGGHLRLINSFDPQNSELRVEYRGPDEHRYSRSEARRSLERLYNAGIVRRLLVSETDHSRLYSLDLTEAGRAAFDAQTFRLRKREPGCWLICLLFFACFFSLAAGVISWISYASAALSSAYEPDWSYPCTGIAMGVAIGLLTWRVVATKRWGERGALLMQLLWIVPTSIAVYIALMLLSTAVAP